MHITNNMEPIARSSFLLIMQTQQIPMLVGCSFLMYVNK